MSAAQSIDHGATIKFSATFKGADDAPITPASAVLHLTFMAIGGTTVTRASVNMTNNAGTFTGSWDSSVANPAHPAYWNIRAPGTDKISEYGRINFDWNPAGLPDA